MLTRVAAILDFKVGVGEVPLNFRFRNPTSGGNSTEYSPENSHRSSNYNTAAILQARNNPALK